MGPGPLRRKLINRELNYEKRALLLREFEYFQSIAPKSLLDNISIVGFFKKISEFAAANPVVAIIAGIFLLPFIFVLLPMMMVGFILLIFINMFNRRLNQSPEYKAYDYAGRIAAPMLQLFDDNLRLGFHPDPFDLVDEQMRYLSALVETHLVMPVNKRCNTQYFSSASYNWENRYDLDAFEFQGYKFYYEWQDSDHETHEEIYFDGCIYKFHTSFFLNGVLNIMSTKTKKNLLGIEKEKNKFKRIHNKDVVVIDTENTEFAENFDTLATYDEEAYRYLTPAMIESLLRLRKEYFFCIMIKGNVMTVAVDNRGYRDARQYTLGLTDKPFYATKNPAQFLDQRIRECGNALLSIYELKDILDPGGRVS